MDNPQFSCYYHPDTLKYVYLESALSWKVIVEFICALVMLLFGVWGTILALAMFFKCDGLVYALCCCCLCCCCKQIKRSNQVNKH